MVVAHGLEAGANPRRSHAEAEVGPEAGQCEHPAQLRRGTEQEQPPTEQVLGACQGANAESVDELQLMEIQEDAWRPPLVSGSQHIPEWLNGGHIQIARYPDYDVGTLALQADPQEPRKGMHPGHCDDVSSETFRFPKDEACAPPSVLLCNEA
jgi:hypothetical protein